jgi:hypothetical protein
MSLQHFTFFKLFGPESSRLGQHFCQKLNISNENYCSFMATFLTSCQFQKPVSKLHSSKHFDSKQLMGLKEYNELWHVIAETGKSFATSDESDPFWMDVEDIVNKDLVDLFLPSDMETSTFMVALDDDKMHFNITQNTECMGLKQQRHIKDNRMGFTAHTSALAAMDVPIRIDMERTRDTPHTCYERQMKKLFGGNCGDGIPNLGNVTIASDRGYWNVPLLFGFLLRAGANIIGTVKRANWFPFTYDRKEGGNDKPTVINPKGSKNSWYKKLQLRKLPNFSSADRARDITAVAYRNGSGNNVSLAMSSMHPAHWWDLNLSRQEDSVWYFDSTFTQSQRNEKAFELDQYRVDDGYGGYGENKSKDVSLITESVEPRTVCQLGQDWFLDRMFSLTSSTVDQAIRAAAPTIDQDDEIYESFKVVLEYAGLERLLQVAPSDVDTAAPTNSTPGEQPTIAGIENGTNVQTNNNEATIGGPIDSMAQATTDFQEQREVQASEGSTRGAQVSLEQNQVIQENGSNTQTSNTEAMAGPNDDAAQVQVADLMGGDNSSHGSEDGQGDGEQVNDQAQQDPVLSFIERVEKCNDGNEANEVGLDISCMARALLIEVLTKLGLKATGATSTLKKDLKGWVTCDPKNRPYYKKTVADLKSLCSRKGIFMGPNPAKKRLEELLVRHDERVLQANTQLGTQPQPNSTPQVSVTVEQAIGNNAGGVALADPVLCAVIKASLLKKQGANKRTETRQGQALEKPFLAQMWKDNVNETSANLPKFRAIYRPGLVAKKGKAYVKDSADAVGIISTDQPASDRDEQSLEVVPIEVKARVAVNTAVRERLQLQALVGLDSYSPNACHYIRIKSQEVSKWIPSDHEQFQLLHHVYCYGSQRGLMLIGNAKRLTSGILVDFDQELLDAWDKVISYIYLRALRWAYSLDEGMDAFPEETIVACLASPRLKDMKLDIDSFKTLYGLWWKLNVKVDAHIRLPLPKCDRILPYQHAFWNVVKGGSDTITKLIDFVEEKIGIRSPSTCVTARFLLLNAVAFHRCYQIVTAKSDLDSYPSLYHFRQAASKRSTMDDSVDRLIDCFRDCQAGKMTFSGSSKGPTEDATNSPGPAIARRSKRANEAKVTNKENWLPRNAQVITPGPGRRSKDENTTGAANSLRASECNGMPLMASLKDPDKNGGKLVPHRKPCVLCGKHTNMQCLSCKRFLCVDKDRSKDFENNKNLDLESSDYTTNVFAFKQTKVNPKTGQQVQETIHSMRSCYHIAHETVIEKELNAKSMNPSFFHRVTSASDDAASSMASQSISCCNLTQNFYNVAGPP